VLKLPEIRERLRTDREMLDRFHVRALALFGSRVRGEARPDSDVDLLVDFDGPIDLIGIIELEEHLAKLLGVRVDLVERDDLKPLLRPRILAEAVSVL
jgi:predicted nucleotidyltransferase